MHHSTKMNRLLKNFMCNSMELYMKFYSIGVNSFFLLLLVCSLNQKGIAQSGWTREKGELWTQASASPWTSRNYINPAGQKLITTPYQQADFSSYLEYGLLKRLTVITNFPFYKLQRYTNTEVVSGIGDLRLELKYGLLRRNYPVSFAVAAELPTGNTLAVARQLENPIFSINLPLGDGEFNVWSTLAASHSFNASSFMSLYFGYNLRTRYKNESFNDQLKPGFELGKQFKGKYWVILKGNCLIPTGSNHQSVDFIRQNGTSYSLYSLFILAPVYKGLGFTLQGSLFADFPVKRQNLYSSPILTAGIFYHLKK